MPSGRMSTHSSSRRAPSWGPCNKGDQDDGVAQPECGGGGERIPGGGKLGLKGNLREELRACYLMVEEEESGSDVAEKNWEN
jgi:hypothetical protein